MMNYNKTKEEGLYALNISEDSSSPFLKTNDFHFSFDRKKIKQISLAYDSTIVIVTG